jgi:hypothetical protein
MLGAGVNFAVPSRRPQPAAPPKKFEFALIRGARVERWLVLGIVLALAAAEGGAGYALVRDLFAPICTALRF